ncbi:MAG: hypothetical protein CBE26_01050 [Kiritimatiellaceae bacterium TMED266]|nr:MAG: hypothetical protein CBE26_01050 [Kiritimatiellaceae bacterium TMED266]
MYRCLAHKYGLLGGLWFCLVVSGLMTAGARGLTVSQLERLDPRGESTSRLLEVCRELLRNEQHAEAVPFLEEAVFRLEDDPDKKAQQTLAFSMFQLSDCWMKMGRYDEAGVGFRGFADLFETDPQVVEARLLSAQCFSLAGWWEEAEEQAAWVLALDVVGDDEGASALRLCAEARFEQQKWEEAVDPLRRLLRRNLAEEDRSRVSVMMVTSLARLNRLDELFRFLPYCNRVARHELGLNVALLEAGDYQFHKDDFSAALLLYREVIPREELLAYQLKRLAWLEGQVKPFVAGQGVSMELHEKRRDEWLEQVRVQRVMVDKVRNFVEYDVELMLRVGQCAHQMKRHWLTFTVYEALMERYPESDLADQAHFASFAVMLDEGDWSLAKQVGYAYLDERSAGLFWDDASLNLMQLLMQLKQDDAAVELGDRALAERSDHRYRDQISFLMGTICFSRFEYEDALAWFERVLGDEPERITEERASFWKGLSMLYLTRFEEAVGWFEAFLENGAYTDEGLREEALYRLGMSRYGAEDYRASEETFLMFVEQYPAASLVSEAYAMLGDLRAAEGALDEGLSWYEMALESAVGVAQFSYPFFQQVKVLELKKEYVAVIEQINGYVEQWGLSGEFGRAVEAGADAYVALGAYPEALMWLLDTLDQFGVEEHVTGIEVVQERLISDYRNESLVGYQDVMLQWLEERLANAEKGSEVLVIRYQTILASIGEEARRDKFVASLLNEQAVRLAGSLGLKVIVERALAAEQYDLVRLAEEEMIRRNVRSLAALEVRVAGLDARIATGLYEEVNAISLDLLEQYGYGIVLTGEARMRAGDALRLQGRYEEAITVYEEVLGVREWRGSLTPQLLFEMGSCRQSLGQWAEAFACFQRIYVLYGGYPDWVVKAYVESLVCLDKLGGREKEMVRTCEEMLSIPVIAAYPEAEMARAYLRRLGGGVE